MSTDQHPEASSDDSGMVPQQAPRADWPKKIRTLSAADLDRLTIDSEGRFYWDGHLVNYQPPQATAPQAHAEQPVDLDALALLDRAARELSGQPAPEPTVDTTAHPPASAPHVAIEPPSAEIHHTETPVASAAPVPAGTAVATVAEVPQVAPMTMYEVPRRGANEKVRLRMSFWQSLALLLVIIGLLIGAAGIAVSGLVAAHEWGCRINLIKQYCPPPPPPPKPPARNDIPA